MFTRLEKLYHQFPSRFWIIVLTFFIDSIGGTLLFPFFSLYITDRFHVGMTQAGMVLAMFSIFGIIGSVAGGALTRAVSQRWANGQTSSTVEQGWLQYFAPSRPGMASTADSNSCREAARITRRPFSSDRA